MSILSVSDLNVFYGPRQVLFDLSFNLELGEILGVIGPNGAGKSTLLRALSAVIPYHGHVEVNGEEISRLNETRRARLSAFVPQARNLPPAYTGWEMVQMGRTTYTGWMGALSATDIRQVRQAMQRLDCFDLGSRRLGDLSGGEQQRLLLARALAQEAPLLLMDEPTTHLDLAHQINLLRQVRSLAAEDGLSVVMALHDLNLVGRFADRVALIHEGRLRALGSPAEVLCPPLLEEVYRLPLQSITREDGVPLILPAVL